MGRAILVRFRLNSAKGVRQTKKKVKFRQTCSSQILYLSNSTKITTNTETTMLSKKDNSGQIDPTWFQPELPQKENKDA